MFLAQQATAATNCKLVSVSQRRRWASWTNHFVLWAQMVRLISRSIIWTAGKGSDHQFLSWNKGWNIHHKSSSSLGTWSVSRAEPSLALHVHIFLFIHFYLPTFFLSTWNSKRVCHVCTINVVLLILNILQMTGWEKEWKFRGRENETRSDT